MLKDRFYRATAYILFHSAFVCIFCVHLVCTRQNTGSCWFYKQKNTEINASEIMSSGEMRKTAKKLELGFMWEYAISDSDLLNNDKTCLLLFDGCS